MKSHNSGTTAAVTIAATPTLIRGYTRELEADPIITINVTNVSNQTVYYGYDSSVTTSNGDPIYPGGRLSDSGYHGNVYAVVASGTAEVRARYF